MPDDQANTTDPDDHECCETCCHVMMGIFLPACANPKSEFYRNPVDPDGYCSAYEFEVSDSEMTVSPPPRWVGWIDLKLGTNPSLVLTWIWMRLFLSGRLREIASPQRADLRECPHCLICGGPYPCERHSFQPQTTGWKEKFCRWGSKAATRFWIAMGIIYWTLAFCAVAVWAIVIYLVIGEVHGRP